jgi:hypothetical protein
MPYSRAFREGLQDALEKARWRMEVHFKSHFLPEERPATLGDLYKSFVVLHDCLENCVTEIVNYLEAELARAKARGDGRANGRGGPARPKARRPRRPAARKSSRTSASRR